MSYSKYNFVFFLNATDALYYKIMFYDAFALSNVRVLDINFANVNNKLSLNFVPYRPANNPAAFRNLQAFNVNSPQAFAEDFPVKNPIVFFFWANFYNHFRAFNFFQYLKSNYAGCKLVCWITNPIHHYRDYYKLFTDKATTKEFLATFDCVLTYNITDAMDYSLTYVEGPYSVLPFEHPKEDIDIFFVGYAKRRLEKILRAYESFKAAGFVCDFHIAGVPNPSSIQAEGLHFNKLSYLEVLGRVMRSKGIMDIAHTGNYGLTLRYFESLAYNKNFITNNAFYRQERFASPKLFLIDRSLAIDKKKFMNASELSSNYRNEYSPLRLVSFLESLLNS